MILIMTVALCAMLPCQLSSAQEGKATRAARPDPGQRVVLGSRVLERNSASGVAMEDLILDLETAHVALLIVRWQHSQPGETYRAVLPWNQVLPEHELDSTFWKSLSQVPPQAIDRAFASSVYASANRDIYWSQQLAAQPEFDSEKFQLTTYSKLVGQTVVDKQQRSLGKITDVGINDTTGEVVYCILTSEDGEHRAVPLGAFAAGPVSMPWVIELNRDQVLAFQASKLKNPPQSVARGWQEYVAVNYGRNALQDAAPKKEAAPSK